MSILTKLEIVAVAAGAMAVTTLAGIGCVRLLMANPRLRRLVQSKLQESFSKPFDSAARSTMLKTFTKIYVGARAGHQHATAAAARNSASASLELMASQLGYTPYVVSPSRRELELQGWRCYYSPNDYAMGVRNDAIPANACIIMTDVDYYADMPYWISLHHPILLYSFMPSSVAGNVDGSSYTFEDDFVRYRVNGGGDFRHQIWDWNHDTLYIDAPVNVMGEIFRKLLTCFGFAYRRTYFTVDSLAFNEAHNIYILLPMRELYIDFLDLGLPLQRMRVSEGKYNKMYFNREGVMWVSIGKRGEYTSVDLPVGQFESVRAAWSLASKHYLADTMRWAKEVKDKGTASILHCYLSQTDVRPNDTLVFEPGTASPHYIVNPKPYEEYIFYARDFAPCPLRYSALAPAVSDANEDATIEMRVLGPQRRSARKVPPPRFAQYAAEFVKTLIGDRAKTGVPIEWSDVAELQTRPSQRVRNERSILEITCDFVVKAFQKKEHYPGIAPPRNISTVPSEHTLDYSTFTRAFKKGVLMETRWYIPGRNPVQISQAVMDLVRHSDSVLETDFSKFDGHQSEWLRLHVEFPAHYLYFKEEFRDRLYELHARELGPKAYTASGKRYSPEYSRLSGAPNTTDGNTILNAFFQYATAREMRLSPKDAYQAIGLAYGDDGLMSAVIKSKIAERTADILGLPVKTNIVTSGHPVAFLSRIFRDPWVCPASIQAPKRALGKINSTVHPDIPIERAGLLKVSGYLITDRLTPAISHWCKAYLRITGQQAVTDLEESDANWFARDPEMRSAPWPQDESDDWVGIVAGDLGVSVCDVVSFNQDCDKAQTFDELPVLPVSEPEHKIDGVIYTNTGSVEVVNGLQGGKPDNMSGEGDSRSDNCAAPSKPAVDRHDTRKSYAKHDTTTAPSPAALRQRSTAGAGSLNNNKSAASKARRRPRNDRTRKLKADARQNTKVIKPSNDPTPVNSSVITVYNSTMDPAVHTLASPDSSPDASVNMMACVENVKRAKPKPVVPAAANTRHNISQHVKHATASN